MTGPADPQPAADRLPLVDATALGTAVRNGERRAVDVMRASLARIEARADLGAVRHLDASMGLAAAESFDAEQTRSRDAAPTQPFAGVPFLMKDLGNAAAGLAPAAGSPALVSRLAPPSADSALAARFRKAGLIPFGLTTTPEFGLALTSEPPSGPIARNPWNLDRSPGGSSGGAAAAVAAGLVAIAHATDAAGSIRVPAACCGLVGLKPTRGAVPNGPAFANHLMGIASELVLARSVRDVEAALRACAGAAEGPAPDPLLIEAGPAAPLRIGVVETAPGLAVIGAEQAAAVASVARLLERQGHQLEAVEADHLARLAADANVISRTILCVSLAEWLGFLGVGNREVSPLAAAAAEVGRNAPATTLFAADRHAALVAHALWRQLTRLDVILTPMLSGPAPAVGAFPMDHDDVEGHFARMGELAPYAALANVGGVPALAVPHGKDTRGLPLSVQLLGRMGSDLALLRLAAFLEQAHPWSYPWSMAGGEA